MSLLLDALKRAEQEKLARQGEGAGTEAASPARQARGSSGLELESVAQAGAASSPAPPPTPEGKRDAEREGAKTVFAAKQAEAQPAPGKNKAILAIVIVAVLLLVGGGAYVWYEINRSTLPPPAMRAPMAPKPVIAAAPEAPKADAAVPADASLKAESVKPGASRPAQSRSAEPLATQILRESESAVPAAPLKLSRTLDPPKVPNEVIKGYEALRRGDLASSGRAYEAALATDPTNVDAILGLATAAAWSGDRTTATRNYRRALELDPKNAAALAGLAALSDFSRPEGLEAQLRSDIARFPQSAALHYTLGALYASQQRWTEAQTSFFEAHRLEPDSADILYNLAVSLDHLGQSRLAADFYQRALAAAQKQNAQFDKGQVSRRIAELKP